MISSRSSRARSWRHTAATAASRSFRGRPGSGRRDGNLTVRGVATALASRLQAQAGKGEVLLSDEAHRRVDSWLAQHNLVADPEILELKGFEKPQEVYRIRAAG
jgi:class 3 adenylate cyclase